MKKTAISYRGYRQVLISAGKREDIKPKPIDTAMCLTTGLSHGSCGQAMNFVAVIYESESKECD